MDTLTSLLGRGGYLPHGYCFTWTPGLLWSMVGADAIIAMAYFSIPLAMVSFVRKRADTAMNWVMWLFIAFIFACGITHVMDIWTIWQPDYALQTLTKMITAAISLVTAVALWPLIPKALKIPSVTQLQSVIGSLETEIQKRRSAEEHLIDVQQSLAVTLSSIGAGFIATDRNGRVTRMNAVAEQVMGWSQAEAQGQNLWKIFDQEDRPASHAIMNPVDLMIEQGITVDKVHHIVAIARDGKRTALELKASPTYADDGAVRGMAMIFRDESELLRAAAEVNRLAAIVESSYDAIIGKTLDGRISSWNEAAQNMFGYSAREAIGQSVQMLIPPERRDEEMHIVAELAHGASVPPFDTVRLAKGGKQIEVSLTISPIRDTQGRIIGASKIARDVSRQRKAEAAMRDSEARLRFTLEAAQLGDWDLDLATGTTQRSLRHDRCFGYSEPQAEWTFETLLGHVHPDDRADVVRSFQIATNELRDWRVECRVIWLDGSVHWIGVNGSIRHEDGEPTHMLGIITDITQQKQAEIARHHAQRLEAENRQIQEASRLKSQFLANMSHELRTPLNAIIGFADLLHSGAVREESPKHHEFLGHIGTSGRHLLQLINDVLDLSKVESGKLEFYPELVNLHQLIKEVSGILHTSVTRKQIVFIANIDPTLTDLVLDPARLKQVLYNYLSNAIKFTPDSGKVIIRAFAEGPLHFRIEVEDSGIGISDADLARLFVEFQQLDSGYSKQHHGTGLGLALTRRLVEAQGGNVGVRSVLGKGSVFHLVLRRNADNDLVPDYHAPAAATAGQGHRFLVIEADWGEQLRVARALSEAGFDVDAASTGEQAVKHAASKTYDALTLDLMLPDQGGLDALAKIRGQGPSRQSPVVSVSMPAEVGFAATFSIADVLSKPIRSEEIIEAMTPFQNGGARSAKVMVIDDDAMALQLMRATLRGIGIEAICMLDGRTALREITTHKPDAIILDLMMPEFDGFEVLDALKRLQACKDTPVFIWTNMILTNEEYARLAQSARTIINKGGGALAPMLDSLRRWQPKRDKLLDGGST
ncbi:MAG TPA: PAS domain S-box protein [Usitatibacteraceae bacterium]